MNIARALAALLFAAPVATSAQAAPRPNAPAPQGDAYLVGYDQRPDVKAFISEVSGRDGFVPEELTAVFARARYNDTVAGLFTPLAQAQPTPWSDYRARFVEPMRIDAGVRFWQAHAADLERAEKIYGVPPAVIVGILDVESLFGRNTGNFRVLDALTTLAFDYPNKERDRAPFFRKQLEDFLILVRDQSLDILSVRGSYAGAIGMPQFMPESIRRYAVDFDGDGAIDLKNDASDAIGSVANFLASQGWQRGQAITYPVVLGDTHDDLRIDAVLAAGSEPHFSPEDLRDAGFVVPQGLSPDDSFTLVNLPDGEAPTVYRIGTRNFYVLTRYNRSYAYACAVIDLGRAIQARLNTPDSQTPDGRLAPSGSGTSTVLPPTPNLSVPAPESDTASPVLAAPGSNVQSAPASPP
ncbi:MAG: lytic murein transglycosylase B [Burkholderiaceae bacterium]